MEAEATVFACMHTWGIFFPCNKKRLKQKGAMNSLTLPLDSKSTFGYRWVNLLVRCFKDTFYISNNKTSRESLSITDKTEPLSEVGVNAG